MELKQKGANAAIGAFKHLKVSLIWTSAVDLDLMAFYKTKDGRVGGVYSNNYASGSFGSLNQFPFIQLSGDEGVGAIGGDNREELRIVKLDDFEELHIVAVNFTDALSGSNKVFAEYDAQVEVVTDRGEKHIAVLDSRQQGSVALICKFVSGIIVNSLINDSEVMSFDDFKTQIPGASQLKLTPKVTLKGKWPKITQEKFEEFLNDSQFIKRLQKDKKLYPLLFLFSAFSVMVASLLNYLDFLHHLAPAILILLSIIVFVIALGLRQYIKEFENYSKP